ncbi:MAG: hypothetical protein Q8L79_07785 [Methylobacter sp.]|uniref:hypothetical protein n=1 Tax=Methylobacter sp. TaxID=2051955 RepID=UPI002730CF5F|nr:hypothetical protein [Methylobacter sp.]MDP1665014.1 hypothetical protein [Methylobacter sp.]
MMNRNVEQNIGLRPLFFSQVAGSYFAAYQYILDVLDSAGAVTSPRDDAVVGLSYNWFVGARQVNETLVGSA